MTRLFLFPFLILWLIFAYTFKASVAVLRWLALGYAEIHRSRRP